MAKRRRSERKGSTHQASPDIMLGGRRWGIGDGPVEEVVARERRGGGVDVGVDSS